MKVMLDKNLIPATQNCDLGLQMFEAFTIYSKLTLWKQIYIFERMEKKEAVGLRDIKWDGSII